jgi:hypothetical protein
MISVKLIGSIIIKNTYNESELSELSVMESIYTIRKLKAVIDSNGDYIDVTEGSDNQVYSEKYKIWFQEGEYKK